MSSLPASIKRIGSETTEKRWRHRFPHYKPMGAFCCHGNQSFDQICPKTLCSLSPTPVMLHIKFDQDWPNGFRDIQVWKCGRRRRTDDGPLVYYKLTLWAFGSGELKTNYKHQNLLYFYAVKTKNKVILCFKHNTVYLNWILVCLKYFLYVSTFPNFQSLCANFPSSDGPAPIPKILKWKTEFNHKIKFKLFKNFIHCILYIRLCLW